jgi:hypothetical protein
MKTRRPEFVVERRALPARVTRKEPEPVVVDKGEREEAKRKAQWARGIAAQEFQARR